MRCRRKHVDREAETLCLLADKEINALEAKGFYQETYEERRKQFDDWHYGVIRHQWRMTKGVPCALCASDAPSVSVKDTTLCLTCLSEYPHVAWHPTGRVRPRTEDFILHAMNCDKH